MGNKSFGERAPEGLEGLRYLATLPDGEASTERGYETWVHQNPDAPHPTTLRQHGGWNTVRSKAQEQGPPGSRERRGLREQSR